MKNRSIRLIIMVWSVFVCSCTQHPKSEATAPIDVIEPKKNLTLVGKPVIEEKDIMADFKSFWLYYKTNIKFFEDFIPFDTAGAIIKKEIFLDELSSGNYYPLVIHSKDSLINYKLAKIPAVSPELAGAYIAQDSRNELVHYKMEGKAIPSFSFSDVNGKLYTSENTKGKIVLFKCWFINCGACILEMPQLNKMVEMYKDRDDILFISLAIDRKKPLQNFLGKTKFDYATIPNQNEYMSKQLKVPSYPYHFLINKEGILVKSVGDANDIEVLLARELRK